MRDQTKTDADTDDAYGGELTLSDGRAWAIQNVVALDGRIGCYPLSVRGYAPINTFLLKQETDALVFDTGFAVHEDRIIAGLQSHLDPGDRLSIFPLRLNELMSVNNAAAIARRIGVHGVYALADDVALWLDFESVTAEESAAHLASLPSIALPGRGQIELGDRVRRVVESLQSPLRLINTRWMHDAETGVLYTSDMFSHVWRSKPSGPWTVDESNDTTTLADVKSFLLNTRYWWLEGASTTILRRAVAALFENRDIEVLAPSYGCILKGRAVVERHISMLDQALAELDRARSDTRYAHHMLER